MNERNPARWWIAIIVLVAVVATVFFIQRNRQNAKTAETEPEAQPVSVQAATAEATTMDTTVMAQGILSPEQGGSAKVASAVTGRVVSVSVSEGQKVKAGAVIAVIDGGGLAQQALSAQKAALAANIDQQNAVKVAELSLATAKSERDHSVKGAQIALDTAKNELKKVQAGARPQELAQADQAVAQATATRDRAATEKARVQDLFDNGVAAKRQVDDAETGLKVAESALESAKQQADLVHAGARPEELADAQLNVDNAKQLYEQAQATGAAHVTEATAALKQAKDSGALGLAAKQQDSAAAGAAAAATVLKAPLDGTVVRRFLNPGDMADPATPVVELSNTRSLNLLASLPAVDGSKVRAGMSVRLTAPDFPERPFTGSVISVGEVDPQTNLMAVRIAVGNPDSALKVGAFVQAAIVLHSNLTAIVVPRNAVLTREGESLVFTVGDDNLAHEQKVKVGVEDGERVEILTGVKAGDRVILLGQYELTDEAPVTVAAPQEGEKP
jgi:HlyD family secretion protein